MKIMMEYEKETPGTYRYRSLDDTAVIQTLYIKKAAFPKGRPEKIEVSVETLKVKAIA
jgi:hypothetical protein